MNEIVVHWAMKSQAKEDILLIITRHDLLNTITALFRNLNHVKSMTPGKEMNLVISRIKAIISAITGRFQTVQVTSSRNFQGIGG